MSIIAYDEAHGLGSSLRTSEEVEELYESWLASHGRSYNGLGEKESRFEVFKDNLDYIDRHNLAADAGEHSYWLGLNEFSDMTNEEFRRMYLGFDSSRLVGRNRTVGERYRSVEGEKLPDSVDWRKKGVVAAVKNQGGCGSCWAFSAIGAVESINKIYTGELVTLSEQELISCDRGQNQGCNGGLMDTAFEFIIKNGGIDTDKDYPYEERDSTCNTNKKNRKVVSINGYEDVAENDENALKKAVANQPVSVAIEAGGRDFQSYKSGIFTGSCGTNLDHGVIAVGYGTENGKDYWIVRNSWGASWGESGYIRMERNIKDSNGKCGIANMASYPVKTSPNPPEPSPSPPTPTPPPPAPSACSKYFSCPSGSTCCCIYEYKRYCFAWGCCPLPSATCCADHSSCCPHDYPVCNVKEGTCQVSKDSPLSVKAIPRTAAKPHWAFFGVEA